MSRPVDWSPLAGSDPVPGDPDRVEVLGRHYRKVAATISDAAAKLRQIAANYDGMESESVDAVRTNAEKVADDITRAHERYDGVGQALVGYAPQLRDAQSESVAALRQAKDAEAAQASANRSAEAAQARVDSAAPGADTTADQGDHRRAQGAAEAAGDALTAAHKRLQRATEARDRAAQQAIGGINEVKNSGDLNDSWWDNWGAKVVKVIVKWADRIAVVAGVLALAVAWIPIIGQAAAAILGTIALVAGLVSLLGHISLAATGYGNWSAVTLAAIGVVTFGIGRAAIAGLKVSAHGVRGASRLAAGRRAATHSGSAMRALRTTLGTTRPMGRNAARNAVRQANQQGFVSSVRNFGQGFRKLPQEFADNVRTLRNADWGDALRQARDGGRPSSMRILGEHGAAADLQDLSRIQGSIRTSNEVAPHELRTQLHKWTFNGAAGYGVYSAGSGAVEWMNQPSSAAETLNLSPTDRHGEMVGARP